MAVYLDEAEVWKCPKHPLKRRRSGVCPMCLRERLGALCPACSNARPCACCLSATETTSSSSSSSAGGDTEPSFRRSRSLAIPFLRSTSRFAGNRGPGDGEIPPASYRSKSSSFWSVFKANKSKKGAAEDTENGDSERNALDDYARMMIRSRSVSAPVSAKGRRWYLPPIKAFRQSKTSKAVQERKPMPEPNS